MFLYKDWLITFFQALLKFFSTTASPNRLAGELINIFSSYCNNTLQHNKLKHSRVCIRQTSIKWKDLHISVSLQEYYEQHSVFATKNWTYPLLNLLWTHSTDLWKIRNNKAIGGHLWKTQTQSQPVATTRTDVTQ